MATGKGSPPRKRAGKGICVLFAMIASALLFFSSNAASAEGAHQNRLQLSVHGSIPEHCAIGSVGDMAFGDLNKTGIQRVAAVGFNCNIPFQISIRSANGGLANEAFPHGQGPYAGLVPYSIALSIPLRRPNSDVLTKSFTSTALMAGASLTSGGGIAVDGMRLTVALAPPTAEAGLLGGRYSETVTITVAPI